MPFSVRKATRVLTDFVRPDRQDDVTAWALFGALPSGLDHALVRAAFARAMTTSHGVRSAGRKLNPEYVELFVEEAARHPSWPDCIAAIALPSGPRAQRARQLGELLKKIDQLGVFSMSRSQAEARVRAFAKDELFVEVARQIVAAGEFDDVRAFHRYAFVAVLVEDASPESLDALLPLVHAALDRGEELDVLRDIVARRKTPSPALAPLRALLERSAAAREGLKRLPAFATALGLAESPKNIHFTWWADGDGVHATVRADFDADPWFEVIVERRRIAYSRFSSKGVEIDELDLEPIDDLCGFPEWFIATTFHMNARWSRQGLTACSLRGKKQQALLRFLGRDLPSE